MDNGNHPPACIPLENFLMKNMIQTNSGLNKEIINEYETIYLSGTFTEPGHN